MGEEVGLGTHFGAMRSEVPDVQIPPDPVVAFIYLFMYLLVSR